MFSSHGILKEARDPAIRRDASSPRGRIRARVRAPDAARSARSPVSRGGTWRAYARPVTAAAPHPARERDRTVLRLLPLVRSVVRRMRLPPGSVDDCVQEGLVGLLRRIEAFDPARGSLRSWVPFTVRFAVKDYLRLRGDSLVRVGRVEARRRKAQGRELRNLCVSLQAAGGPRDADAPPATPGIVSHDEPHTAVVERRDLLAHAVTRISRRERAVIDLLYPRDGGEPLALTGAGQRLGISASRVAQIRGDALRKMRAAMGSLDASSSRGRGVGRPALGLADAGSGRLEPAWQ